MIAAGGNWRFLESNDRSLGDLTCPTQDTSGWAGIGTLSTNSPSDQFALLPEFQGSSVDFAYVVTPTSPTGANHIRMTLGLYGEGIIDAGTEGGAAFGYNGNPDVLVPFAVAEPSTGPWNIVLGLVLLGITLRNRRR